MFLIMRNNAVLVEKGKLGLFKSNTMCLLVGGILPLIPFKALVRHREGLPHDNILYHINLCIKIHIAFLFPTVLGSRNCRPCNRMPDSGTFSPLKNHEKGRFKPGWLLDLPKNVTDPLRELIRNLKKLFIFCLVGETHFTILNNCRPGICF